jgi:predicted transposase YdaD
MSKTYDTTLRFPLDRYPEDWLRLIGAPGTGPVDVLDTKLTQAFEADKIFRAAKPRPQLYHLEFQATYDEHLPERILVYNTLAHRQHRLPVHSVAILLRPMADGPEMTGQFVRERIRGDRYLEFRYDVIRVWQMRWRDVAAAGVGALPLATLTDDAERDAATIVGQFNATVRSRRSSTDLYALWSAVHLMLGLKYSELEISESWEGVRIMSLSDVLQESSTFQAILKRGREEGREEGRLEALREVLLDLGTRILGQPTKRVRSLIAKTTDVGRLDELIQRLPDAESWKDLLNGA